MLLFWLLGPRSSDPLGAVTIRGSAQWQTSLVQVPRSGRNRHILIVIVRFSLDVPSRSNDARWCPNGSKMRALDSQSAPTCSQVSSKSPQRTPRCPKCVQGVATIRGSAHWIRIYTEECYIGRLFQNYVKKLNPRDPKVV